MFKLIFYTFYLIFIFLLITLLTTRTMPKLVLTLITVFVSLFVFLLFLSAEFIGISFLIVYIGAIAILFIFTLMVVSADTQIARDVSPLPLAIVLLLLAHFAWTLICNLVYRLGYETITLLYITGEQTKTDFNTLGTHSYDLLLFGSMVYTTHKELFLLSGLLLLIAILGVIALTIPSKATAIPHKELKPRKPWF